MSNTHAAIDLTEDEGSHMPKTENAEEATDDAMVAAMSGMNRDMRFACFARPRQIGVWAL